MKKHNIVLKFGFTVLASLVLAACGSGGGGDGNNSSTVTTNTTAENSTPNNANNSTSGNSGSTASQTAASGTGQVLIISGENAQNASLQTLNTTNLTAIEVDGVTLTISRPGIYAGGWTIMKTADSESQVCCGKYSFAKIGHYDFVEQKGYLFYNGIPTAVSEIPTAGSATYNGDSIYLSTLENLEEDYYRGTAALTANFSDNTLTGQLKNDVAQIEIDSTINQNTFSGTATSSLDSASANVEGKFYGSNAKE